MNDRKRLLIMLPILGIAGWLAFFGDKAPVGKDTEVVGAVVPARSRSTTPRAATSLAGTVTSPAGSASAPLETAPPVPSSPREAIKLALAKPPAANLFGAPPPPPAPAKAVVDDEAPPAPPPPHFTVIGSVLKDGRFNVFLDKDNQTYIAAPGAVLDGNRVDVVKSDQVQLFNLSTKTTQIIPIEGDK